MKSYYCQEEDCQHGEVVLISDEEDSEDNEEEDPIKAITELESSVLTFLTEKFGSIKTEKLKPMKRSCQKKQAVETLDTTAEPSEVIQERETRWEAGPTSETAFSRNDERASTSEIHSPNAEAVDMELEEDVQYMSGFSQPKHCSQPFILPPLKKSKRKPRPKKKIRIFRPDGTFYRVDIRKLPLLPEQWNPM